MPLSDAAMNVGATAVRAVLGGAQIHYDNPGTGGAAAKSAAPMVVPAWGTPAADGDFDLAADLVFSGGTPNGPVWGVSLWSNTSGSGVWYGNFPTSGDATFDSAGNYTVDSIDLDWAAG